MKKIVVVLASLLVVACASTPKPESQAAEKNTPSVSIAAVSATETESHKLAAEIQNLQQQSVFFDLDKSSIKKEYRDALQAQAKFAKAHKNDMVTIEGNCDERGSAEYNLALGERRANTARKSLELMGVPASQIKTVSFGLEKPRLTCHEEKCWKENRRDDFVHKLN